MPDTPGPDDDLTPEQEAAYLPFVDALNGWYARLYEARAHLDEAAWRAVCADMADADPFPGLPHGPATVVANFADILGNYLRAEASDAGATIAVMPTALDDPHIDPAHDYLTAASDMLRAATNADAPGLQAVLDRTCAGCLEEVLIVLMDVALLLPDAVEGAKATMPPATPATRSHLN